MADDAKMWYRLGFRAGTTEPMLNQMAEIGRNDTARVKQIFLAPVNDEGMMDLTAIHGIDVAEDGRPNGFHASVEDAKAATIDTLNGQVNQIQAAISGIQAYEPATPELKLTTQAAD